jgi:diphthamide synthase subunit DPH2
VGTESLPVPNCPYCGKPIKDLAAAVADKHSDTPVHFDCIIAKIAESETLEKEDTIAYIGGGCFGILRCTGSQHKPRFTIKKVVEWEDREQRAPWRKMLSDRYSTT